MSTPESLVAHRPLVVDTYPLPQQRMSGAQLKTKFDERVVSHVKKSPSIEYVGGLMGVVFPESFLSFFLVVFVLWEGTLDWNKATLIPKDTHLRLYFWQKPGSDQDYLSWRLECRKGMGVCWILTHPSFAFTFRYLVRSQTCLVHRMSDGNFWEK